MAILVATPWNPVIRAFHRPLRDRDQPSQVALTTTMHQR